MFDLPDADPWDGLGWSKHLGLLWHLTSPEGLEEHRAAIPPPPLPGAGHAEKVAYWTPLVHAARFQLGLRRPGAGLAALSERPRLAAELSPLAPHQSVMRVNWCCRSSGWRYSTTLVPL